MKKLISSEPFQQALSNVWLSTPTKHRESVDGLTNLDNVDILKDTAPDATISV